MSKEIITADGEVIETSGLPVGYGDGNQPMSVALAKAEVDQQITTAHAYPRNPRKAMMSITSLATLDEETAEECVYALPRGNKPIKGPSIRLAEIIAGQWGNCRIGARVVHVDRIEKYVEAEGVFHDLETNTATTARVRRRISGRDGRVFNDDMIVVTGNAACAIAKRNAILGAVPKAVWRKAYAEVESVIAGDVKTLSERRDRAVKAFAAFGVTPEQLFAAISVEDMEGITLEHLPTLTGMRAALKSGESTVEEMFPRIDAKGEAPKGTKGKLDALAVSGKEGAPTEKSAASKPADKAKEEESQAEDDEELAERAASILGRLGHRPIGIDADDPAQVFAYSFGMAAAEEGKPRNDLPADLKSNQSAAAAWRNGYDYASASAGEGGEA